MAPRRRTSRSRTERGTPAPAAPLPWLVRHAAPLILVATMLFVTVVRLRVADVPLERDEGEYAYAGQLILDGAPPYTQAYNMKFPGTYYAYSVVLASFGQTPAGIRRGLLCVNLLTILVVFAIGRRLMGDVPAAVGASAFAFLALDLGVMGIFAHATHFEMLAVLAGLWLLLRARDSTHPAAYAGAGVLLGLAVLMKQHAMLFVPFALAWAWWSERRRGAGTARGLLVRLGLLSAGVALPFGLMCAFFAAQGIFSKFWFWTFAYAREYVTELSWAEAADLFSFSWHEVTEATSWWWALAGVGLVAIWIGRPSADRKGYRDARGFLTGLAAASALAICPGFYFRQHYFIQILPAVGLFVGVAIDATARVSGRAFSPGVGRAIAGLVFAGVVGAYVVHEQPFLFAMSPRDISRSRYQQNPFIEAEPIAQYLASHTDPSDRIGVLGSEPEIYFLAHRRSATGYIYMYPLVEPQRFAARMQTETIQEIERAHPKYVVLVQVPGSWAVQAGADPHIMDWGNEYTSRCYDQVGVADIFSAQTSEIRWDAAVAGYRPRSMYVVYTYVRKGDAPCRVGAASGGGR
jgi:hypothetical protein